MSDEQARSKLDALMHEWHEWASRGGRQPEDRYADCGGMADFVIKHMGEWLRAVPWCETHDEMIADGNQQCRWVEIGSAYPAHQEPCRLQDPPKVWRQR